MRVPIRHRDVPASGAHAVRDARSKPETASSAQRARIRQDGEFRHGIMKSPSGTRMCRRAARTQCAAHGASRRPRLRRGEPGFARMANSGHKEGGGPHQPHPGTRINRCRCSLPGLTGFTIWRCEGTGAGHHRTVQPGKGSRMAKKRIRRVSTPPRGKRGPRPAGARAAPRPSTRRPFLPRGARCGRGHGRRVCPPRPPVR